MPTTAKLESVVGRPQVRYRPGTQLKNEQSARVGILDHRIFTTSVEVKKQEKACQLLST